MHLAPGSTIASRYRVLRELGRGGMGVVYVVEHVGTGDHLALKVLLGGAMSAEALERFKRESRAPAKIKSEHVVRVVDADTAPELGGAPFLVMELLNGTDLQKLVKERGRFLPDEVVGLLAQVARALDKSHALGIVHRDLKPENLFLHQREDGGTIVKVLDFGISKVLSGGAMSALPMTQVGAVMGTPLYMAPEQARGAVHAVGPATDVWALGMIAVYLLTGEAYWARVPAPHGWASPQSLTELISLIIQAELYPPSRRWPFLPPTFDAWLARACARDPAARFATAGQAVEELATALGTAASGVAAGAEGTLTDLYGATAVTPSGQPQRAPFVPPPPPPPAPVPLAPHVFSPMPSPVYGMAPPTMPGVEVVGALTEGAVAHTLTQGPPPGTSAGKLLAIAGGLLALAGGVGLVVWALVPAKPAASALPPEPPAVVLPVTAPTTVETEAPLPELHHPAGALATGSSTAALGSASGGGALGTTAKPAPTAASPPASSSASPSSTAVATASSKPGGTVDGEVCKKTCASKCASAPDRFACISACLFDDCSNF
jgi:serine/threonine-protein kinase